MVMVMGNDDHDADMVVVVMVVMMIIIITICLYDEAEWDVRKARLTLCDLLRCDFGGKCYNV